MTAEPYLSVVVTTRNDDHGGDPLKRLQAFVNCLDAQCRRTGLDAEVIIVEWNPPMDKPRLQTLVRWPTPCVCTYRFITVPPELHDTLEYSDVLPLFQMIAKNVGIRRARGRYVLATNIDIVFSNELVEYLASGRLEPGRLYRVDRHDIQSDLPVDAPLDAQMAYCAEHQLRIHARWGSYAVDGLGRALPMPQDIVDGTTVRLGSGWHVREGAADTGFCRWATDRAFVHIDRSGDPAPGPAVLEIDTQANPYAPAAWVDLEIADESGAVLARHRVTRRRIWRLRLEDTAPRTFELRVAAGPPGSRRHLAAFERREAMNYQVRAIRVTSVDDAHAPLPLVYPDVHWHACEGSAVEIDPSGGVRVTTSSRQYAYGAKYGPMVAPEAGLYRFTVTYDVSEGDVQVGVLDEKSSGWLPAVVDNVLTPRGHVAAMAVELAAGATFTLMFANDHVEGEGVSRLAIRELTGSIDPVRLLAVRRRDVSEATPATLVDPIRRSPPAERQLTRLEAWAERRVRRKEIAAEPSLVFSPDGWQPANFIDVPDLERVDDGIAVVSRGERWRYCVEHGPFRAPVSGTYHFAIDYRPLEGGIVAGLLNEGKRRWLESSSREQVHDGHSTLTVSATLRAGQTCWLTLSNNHDAGGISRFVITGLRGSVEPRDLLAGLLELTEGRNAYWRGHEVLAIKDGAEYPPDVWRIADGLSTTRLERATDGLSVETPKGRGSYALVAGPIRSPARCICSVSLTCDVADGAISLGALSRHKTRWLPSWSDGPAVHGRHTLTTSVELAKGQLFWLIVSNAHPDADQCSRFLVRGTACAIEPITWRVAVKRMIARRWTRVADRMTGVVARVRRRLPDLAHPSAAAPGNLVPGRVRDFVNRLRASIVHRSPEYAVLLAMRQALEGELARISPLGELAHLHKLLQDHRPDPLHLNGCGDFQLMAREHWQELRGYPEFQTFSMNIDGLFSSIAHYARVTERVLESPYQIYHLEHEVGSGWTPEGEAVLRRRIAERGITWLDSRDVFVWSTYMHWLRRPMIFNESGWGFGSTELEESIVEPRVDHV